MKIIRKIVEDQCHHFELEKGDILGINFDLGLMIFIFQSLRSTESKQ